MTRLDRQQVDFRQSRAIGAHERVEMYCSAWNSGIQSSHLATANYL